VPTMGASAQELKLSGPAYDANTLAPEDAWIGKLDHTAFREDIQKLGQELAARQGPADVVHLNKMIWWSRSCFLVGVLTMSYCINPLSIYLISLGIMSRWTIIGHHVCHGGFDKCSDGKYNRFKFGVGSLWRRRFDWLDWMLVEAWNVEHNQLHHYCLGEVHDPDLVEHNLLAVRDLQQPQWLKRVVVFVMAATWKWHYYAPNTFKMLKIHELRRVGKVPTWKGGETVPASLLVAPWTVDASWFFGQGPVFFRNAEFFGRVLGPFFVRQFVVLPCLAGLVFGRTAVFNSLISLLLAEVLTNLHSFLVIVTNHAGDDLYRFDRHCKARTATFYLRQIISSGNFSMGTDFIDFHHGWLNYQVEHHLWPDLSMLSYQKAAPLVRSICSKHGVPYIQHSVFWRLKKTVDIMTGVTSMRRFPTKWEVEDDLAPVDEATH